MSPMNRFFESVISRLNEQNKERKKAMARIKETDRRPTRIFKLGDLVTPHPKRSDLVAVGDGIVISISEKILVGGLPDGGQKIQFCTVFFAAREVDLWLEVRRWARDTFCAPKEMPEGISLPAGDLVYTGRSEPEWLDPPDMDEISLARFGEIME